MLVCGTHEGMSCVQFSRVSPAVCTVSHTQRAFNTWFLDEWLFSFYIFWAITGSGGAFYPQTTRKLDKIHATVVSRHWTTGSVRLIPERETNGGNPSSVELTVFTAKDTHSPRWCGGEGERERWGGERERTCSGGWQTAPFIFG